MRSASSSCIRFLNSAAFSCFSFLLFWNLMIVFILSFLTSASFYSRFLSSSARSLSAFRYIRRSFLRIVSRASLTASRFACSRFFKVSTSVFTLSSAAASTLSSLARYSFSRILRSSSRSIFIEAFDFRRADSLLAFECSCVTKSSIGT